MATLTNTTKHSGSLANRAKNVLVPASGGEVFFGFLFLFTQSAPASGPQLANIAKHSGALTNVAKH